MRMAFLPIPDSNVVVQRREHEIGAEERNLLKAVVRMLLDLQLYKTVLEPAVVSESKRFYTSESAEHMLRIDTSVTLAAMTEYLSHVATRIREEQDRCSSLGYLDIGSRKQLVGIVEDKLVKQNVASLLKEGKSWTIYVLLHLRTASD